MATHLLHALPPWFQNQIRITCHIRHGHPLASCPSTVVSKSNSNHLPHPPWPPTCFMPFHRGFKIKFESPATSAMATHLLHALPPWFQNQIRIRDHRCQD
ncbi:hypothetical protein RIF29_30979 [Crotalaria pallida]|uniref:Uncharacterized protein n=1 Tax=Crotalaria pallida TaxID=3830 RepID=A0AAN9EGR1_CROPI